MLHASTPLPSSAGEACGEGKSDCEFVAGKNVSGGVIGAPPATPVEEGMAGSIPVPICENLPVRESRPLPWWGDCVAGIELLVVEIEEIIPVCPCVLPVVGIDVLVVVAGGLTRLKRPAPPLTFGTTLFVSEGIIPV